MNHLPTLTLTGKDADKIRNEVRSANREFEQEELWNAAMREMPQLENMLKDLKDSRLSARIAWDEVDEARHIYERAEQWAEDRDEEVRDVEDSIIKRLSRSRVLTDKQIELMERSL